MNTLDFFVLSLFRICNGLQENNLIETVADVKLRFIDDLLEDFSAEVIKEHMSMLDVCAEQLVQWEKS